ncbi:unnamed protein product [Prorocentrum cordatum]|uniref:Cellulase n=1 Tax=Prorocentrum cordatum TaxID=2364126 RepID=A0ABN9T3R1_9DINO|nr:unnamed protein product [Polarella glacialis]
MALKLLALASVIWVGNADDQPTRLRITSACETEPMWIAHEAGAAVGPDPQNIKLDPGMSHDMIVTDNLKATRYWPKFRCSSAGDQCAIGGSGGPDETCDEHIGCAPAIDSKFEATFGEAGQPCNTTYPPGEYTGCDWLDISMVDGFTVPFRLVIKGDCKARVVQKTNVTQTINCAHISTDMCPDAEKLGQAGTVSLKAVHPNTGEVVGCYAPCSKLTFQSWNNAIAKDHQPQDALCKDYCCPTPPESPEACRTGPVKDTAYVKTVHQMCPGVYGYSYDDGVGLMTCPAGTAYEMIFYCPTSPSPSPPPPGPPSPPSPPPPVTCSVGDSVSCPGTGDTKCAGDSCCPDGSICPSADPAYHGCPQAKERDCTQPGMLEYIVF